MYDRHCESCGFQKLDCLESVVTADPACPGCGARFVRAWLSKPSAVISDECDVVVTNGICNPDGSPRRYRFKSEMRAEAARRGLVNHVEHLGTKSGDRSPHTSRWI